MTNYVCMPLSLELDWSLRIFIKTKIMMKIFSPSPGFEHGLPGFCRALQHNLKIFLKNIKNQMQFVISLEHLKQYLNLSLLSIYVGYILLQQIKFKPVCHWWYYFKRQSTNEKWMQRFKKRLLESAAVNTWICQKRSSI